MYSDIIGAVLIRSVICGRHSVEIENLSGFIQQHTAVVCLNAAVCAVSTAFLPCIRDIVYIYALGEQVPLHALGLTTPALSVPGETGCAMPRYLRPYRCNWYFCSPLLSGLRTQYGPSLPFIYHTPAGNYHGKAKADGRV